MHVHARIIRSVLCLLVSLRPWAARGAVASDPLQFAPERVDVVFHSNLHRGVKVFIDEVEERFATNDAVKSWIARLRAFEVGGLRPGAGIWPPGLDPNRSVTLFWYNGAEAMRIVVGSQDASKGVASLAGVLSAISPDLACQASGLELQTADGRPALRCADRSPWLVCDTHTDLPPPALRPASLSRVDTGENVELSAFIDMRAFGAFTEVVSTVTAT
jgi:hypothetical protein